MLQFVFVSIQLLLIDKKTSDVHDTLSTAGSLIETYNGQPVQKESLKVFFLVLQVCHYLMAGQVSGYVNDIECRTVFAQLCLQGELLR